MTDRQTGSFAQLLPYLEADTQLTDTVNEILLMVRQLVGTVSNRNLTLENLIQGNEQIMELMNLAFNNSHDAVGLLLNAPFRNPGKLIEIFVAEDPFGYLCNPNSSEIQEVFSIPSNVDAERVHSAVADPGFSPGGGANSQKCYYFSIFCRKLHENERIWTPRGGRASLAPPLGSANVVLYAAQTKQYWRNCIPYPDGQDWNLSCRIQHQ